MGQAEVDLGPRQLAPGKRRGRRGRGGSWQCSGKRCQDRTLHFQTAVHRCEHWSRTKGHRRPAERPQAPGSTTGRAADRCLHLLQEKCLP